MTAFSKIVQADPAVDTVSAFTGGGNGTNTARLFMQLKPKSERKVSADQVIARLRGKTGEDSRRFACICSPVQDVSVGGRVAGAQYQYTLQADQIGDLTHWAPILMERMRKIPELRDVNSDQQLKGLQASVVIDRDTAYRLGVSMQAIDDTLNDAFGQRQVSVMYEGINQYYVVMEVLPEFQQDPSYLQQVYVASNTGKLIPLSAFAHYAPYEQPAYREPSGRVSGHHAVIQSCAQRFAGQRRERYSNGAAANADAGHHPRYLSGNRAGFPGLTFVGAGFDSCGAGGRLYRAGDSV